jgi:hypothetical protein
MKLLTVEESSASRGDASEACGLSYGTLCFDAETD